MLPMHTRISGQDAPLCMHWLIVRAMESKRSAAATAASSRTRRGSFSFRADRSLTRACFAVVPADGCWVIT